MSRTDTLLCIGTLLLALGCSPGIKVRKNPDALDTGIRYYRPKPYLLVAPTGETTGSGDKAVVRPSDQYVSLELRYLPDFSEEYSITVRPGLGVANVKVELQDGWNLTSINQELDSKFAENIEAVSKLVGAAAPSGLVGTPKNMSQTVGMGCAVAARNIPLGFYEAVIGRDDCGRKQLYGWRYVGFAPYSSCPLYASGQERMPCQDDGYGSIYGLTFHNGVMVFKPLLDMACISAEQAATQLPPAPASALTPAQKASLISSIWQKLNDNRINVTGAGAQILDGATTESICVVITLPVPTNATLVKAIVEETIKSSFSKATVTADVMERLPQPDELG